MEESSQQISEKGSQHIPLKGDKISHNVTSQIYNDNFKNFDDGSKPKSIKYEKFITMNLDKLVEEIESDSLSPNTCDEYLGCILTLASSMGEIQLVQSALKKGAVVEGNDSWDVSPLFEACRNNHPEIVQLLLEHGANVNHTTRNGIRPLHIACRGGNIKIVEMLVAAGADIKARTQMGNDAMMEAHKYGHTDCFELLLDKGGYIEEPDPESRGHINGELGRPLQAPFTFFCFRGPIELIKCMLEHKRAKDAIDVQELSFGLLEASLEGRVDVARLLVQYGLDVKMVNTNHESPLQVAAKNGHINFINFLLDSGVDINYTTSEGVTALMEACWNGRYETVKLLVGRGADLNLFSPESLESAISLAAMAGQFGIVKHLTAHGVRIDPLCNVAMLKAIRSGHSFMLQHFVNVGADVNYIHKSTGETALTTACDARSENAVDFLLEKGAKADLAMGDNLTPLMIAAKRGLNSIVDMLIKKRVNLSKVTCDNKHSALSLACCYGHKHVVVKLINAGAKVNHVYANNETLLTYLAKSVHTDVLEAICSFVRVLELDVSEFACRSLDRIQIDKYRHLLDCYREHGFTPIPEYQALKEYFESQDDEQKSKSTRNKQNQPAKGKKRTINRSKLRESTSVESEITSNDTKLGTEDKSSMLNAKVGPGCDTALSISVKLCRIDVVKALAKFGAEVDCRDKSGQTPLMLASKIGRHTMVKTLIESGANVNESCSFKGYSALCYAALHSKTDCAKLLLSAGANKNHAGHDRMTPLCLAVSSGSIEMVKLLLDKKAEADRTSQGPLPIMCSTNPNKEIVSLLLTHGADPQAEYKGVSFFANVCNQSDIETLIFIIDHCRTLNLERKNRFGHTPLMQAVINDQKSVASVLIDAGAEINNTYQANPEKDNPLTTATAMGNYEMMELLLEKGAVVEHRNKNKYTAISVAAIKGDLKAVELLFKKKACASPKNGNQESPLKLALRGGHLDVVTFLSDKVQSFPSETEKDIILSEIAQDNQILRQSIIDCYKVIMDNKIKKDATNPKHVESSPGDLRVENITKREEQIPKTSNSKKKRDKKKKKKTMTSPETQTTLPAEVKKEPAPMTKAEKSPQAQPSKVEKPVVPAPPKVEKPTPPIPIKTEKTVPTPKTVKKQTATTVIDEKPAVESSTAQAVNDSDEWENIGARRTQKTQSDMVHRVHKCKIPSRLVGRLIGKSGASINEIRTRTNTTIDVDTTNKNANDECDVTVRGFTKDAKIVFSFIAEIISNPDRATTAILDDIERNKSLSPVSFTVVSNTKDRMNFHSAPKYESYTRESFTFNPPINHDTPSSQPDVLKSYITNNRPIIRVDDSQNSLIINQDPRPRVIQPTATVQSIPASNVVWSTAYEPKITTSRTNLTAPMDQLSVGSSVTFAQATSNARSFSQCPGTGRSSSPSATVNKFECPILHTIKTKFNIGITIDEDLWNLTSAQDQPFPATVAEYLNNIKPQQDEDQDQDDLKDNQPNDNSSSLRTFQTRPLV